MKFEIYSRLTLRGRRWFWRLLAANGEIIASGEPFNTSRACRESVYLVQGGARSAPIEQ